MAVREILEEQRQFWMRDGRYWRHYLYFLELVLPQEVRPVDAFAGGGNSGYIYPLVLAPQRYELGMPFNVELDMGGDGGLIAQENGVTVRPLSIAGNFGVKPKGHLFPRSHAEYSPQLRSFSTGNRAFTGLPLALSGQRHLEVIEEQVFGVYGDMKRHPSYAAGTRLFWHNQKDAQHFRVIPRDFRISRSAARRTMYDYEIELWVVSNAEESFAPSALTDGGFFAGIKNFIATIRKTIQFAKSIIQDVQSFVAEIERVVAGFGNIIKDFISIIDDVSALISKTADVVLSPVKQLTSIIDRLEGASRTAGGLPDAIYSKGAAAIRGLQQAAESLALFRSSWVTGRQQIPRSTRARRGGAIATGTSRLTSGQDATSSLTAVGEALAHDARAFGATSGNDSYQGSKVVPVMDADTVQAIADRHGVPWRDVADVNLIIPPFITQTGEPGTLKPGDPIVIPTREAPPTSARASVAVVGVDPEASEEDRLLGEDFLLEPTGEGTYDFKIAGSGDHVERVSGVRNLEQAIRTIVETSQGEDRLYPELGVAPVIGTGAIALDREMLSLRFTQAIGDDDRIASAPSVFVQLQGDSPDDFRVEVTAVIRGFRQPVVSRTAIRPRPVG